MAPQKQPKNDPKSKYPLAERVLFDYCLLQIYDEGKKHDEFAHSEDIVQSLKELVDKGNKCETEDDLDNGTKAEDLLTSFGLADVDRIEDKNDERVINLKTEYKSRAIRAKSEKINGIINFPDDFKKSFFSYIRDVHGINNFEKQVISGPIESKSTTYPKAKNVLSSLKDNFDDLKQSLPDHKLATGSMGKRISSLISGVSSGKKYIEFKIKESKEDNKTKNNIIRDNFRDHEDAKKKFFKLMGHMLQYAKDDNPKHIEEIKKLTNTPESSEAIAKRAKTLYTVMIDSLWTYKNEHNYDPMVNKSNYEKNNVDRWIKKLTTGFNDFKSLAFIEENALDNVIIGSEEYDKLVNQHITIHHKLIDVKYHALVDEKGVSYKKYKNELHPLNQIGNMMMVIGKELHDREFHQHDGDFLKSDKKNSDIAYVRTQPTQDIFLAIGSDGTKKRVSMNIPVSKEISDVISNSAETQNKLSLMQKHTSVKAY